MKAIIICGGTAPSYELFMEELKTSNCVICADSGGNYLFSHNVMPDFLIGDFDSIETNALEYFANSRCNIIKYPREKDNTDSELALMKAVEIGASEIVFLGCTGSRLDHVFGNIGLLLQCLKWHIKGIIKDDNNEILLTDSNIILERTAGTTFSLIPYGMEVNDVTIKGAKYPLNTYKLPLGTTLSLSNEFIDNIVEITFNGGLLLVALCND